MPVIIKSDNRFEKKEINQKFKLFKSYEMQAVGTGIQLSGNTPKLIDCFR